VEHPLCWRERWAQNVDDWVCVLRQRRGEYNDIEFCEDGRKELINARALLNERIEDGPLKWDRDDEVLIWRLLERAMHKSLVQVKHKQFGQRRAREHGGRGRLERGLGTRRGLRHSGEILCLAAATPETQEKLHQDGKATI
jgi:hypothetical protein